MLVFLVERREGYRNMKREEKKYQYRNSSFHAQFEGSVTALISLGETLLVICENSIYEMDDPSVEDPNYNYPFAPNTSNKLLDFSFNKEIALLYLDWIQSISEDSLNIKEVSNNEFPHFGLLLRTKEEIATTSCSVKYKIHFKENKESIIKIILNILTDVINIDRLLTDLVNKYNTEVSKISDNLIKEVKTDRVVHNSLKINDLDNDVKQLIIVSWGHIFHNLINLLKISNKDILSKNNLDTIASSDKNFKKFSEILKTKLSQSQYDQNRHTKIKYLSSFIDDCEKDWLGKMLAMRNALEHPDNRKKFIIENFQITFYKT